MEDETFQHPWNRMVNLQEDDDKHPLVQMTAERLVKAILDRQSGLIPGPKFDPFWSDQLTHIMPFANMSAMAQSLDIDDSILMFFLAQEVLSCFREKVLSITTDADDLGTEVLKAAREILKSELENDSSHYLCNRSLPVRQSTYD